MSENKITAAQAIDAVLGQFKKDDRVTAYQVAQLAEAVLEVLGVKVKLATQPVYNQTKDLRLAAKIETGDPDNQAMRIEVIKPVVAKLVAKGLGQTVGGGKRLDKAALMANALSSLSKPAAVETPKVEQPKPTVTPAKPVEPKKN